MCGIFAWSGENVKHFNKAKFDILGIFNDSRGGDSCGVASDGEIYYGVATGLKRYSQFLAEKNYLTPTKFPVVIGHTRKSSVGIINENNAHPFGFGVNEKHDAYEFIGVHNGTLFNHDDIAKDYDIEISVNKLNDYNVSVFDRRKIDSEVLLETIYKTKHFKVLSEYNGGAAILFTNTLEPNIIYAFHGASSETKNGTPIEERPLYYYQETKNSLYISSMAESLIAIGGEMYENVDEFECNKVYKIKNGNLKAAEIFDISRINALQKKPTVTYGNTTHHSRHDYGYGEEWDGYKEENKNKHWNKKKEREVLKNSDNIYEEQIIYPYKNKKYVFNQLRFRRNGHLVTGIFTYFKEYGLVPLEIEPHQVSVTIASMMGSIFSFNTEEFTSSITYDMVDDINYTVPFKVGKKIPPILYIYEGCMMETDLDYITLKKQNVKDTYSLSHCSMHPIVDASFHHRHQSVQNIVHKGKSFTGKISPFYSNKIYNIINGNLKQIQIVTDIIEDNEKPVIILPESNSQIKLPLNISCINIDKVTYDKEIVNFIDKVNKDLNVEDKVKEKVDDLLVEHYQTTLDLNDKLTTLGDNKFANEAIKINCEYMDCMREFSNEISK